MLLLNYFIFVNLFELAIFSIHCPTLLKFVQEGYFLFLEMPVNLSQCRVAIGVFKNRILITSKKHYITMVVFGDFNAKSKSWYTNDSTNFEGSKIDFLTSSFGFHQIINKPTHILNNSSSCIDLIFTTQPNLVMESGVHSSLRANCHHQLPYVKFNLNIFYHRLINEKCGIMKLRILI